MDGSKEEAEEPRKQVEWMDGGEKRPIILVDYDPAWPALYEAARIVIENALGALPHRTSHVGSTSVPRLRAKPIVDIQLSVPNPDDEQPYRAPLETAGYVLRVREPGHRMLRTPTLDAQVHVCAIGSQWEREHLLFRDWLRHSYEDRRLYLDVKEALAPLDWPTVNDYADAKSGVIAQIMLRAEPWAAHVGWSVEGSVRGIVGQDEESQP